MPPFPGDPKLRSLLAVHSTRNGVPLERIKDGTAEAPRDDERDVPRETPVEEPEAEPPPAAARKRR